MYREKAVLFGPRQSLVGVVTSPRSGQETRGPVLVLLNSGLIHRVGVSRVHVQLARAFADQGFQTLRFDLAGIGDSQRAQDPGNLSDSVNDDIGHALAFLRDSHGSDQFVLMGLCSGAHDALTNATVFPEVAGVVLIDLPGPFLNWQHTYHHLRRRIFRWGSWKNAISNLFSSNADAAGASKSPGNPVQGDTLSSEEDGELTRPEMEGAFGTLLQRGVDVQLIFTAGVEALYNHETQFQEVFPAVAEHDRVSVHYFPDSDHVFGKYEQRQKLQKTVSTWLQEHF